MRERLPNTAMARVANEQKNDLRSNDEFTVVRFVVVVVVVFSCH